MWGDGIDGAMKMFNVCVVLLSSCLALLAAPGTASARLGPSIEHPFDDMYEDGYRPPKGSPELNRAA